jgi:hypothetical protein
MDIVLGGQGTQRQDRRPRPASKDGADSGRYVRHFNCRSVLPRLHGSHLGLPIRPPTPARTSLRRWHAARVRATGAPHAKRSRTGSHVRVEPSGSPIENIRFFLRVDKRPTLSISGGAKRRPLHAVVSRPPAFYRRNQRPQSPASTRHLRRGVLLSGSAARGLLIRVAVGLLRRGCWPERRAAPEHPGRA